MYVDDPVVVSVEPPEPVVTEPVAETVVVLPPASVYDVDPDVVSVEPPEPVVNEPVAEVECVLPSALV